MLHAPKDHFKVESRGCRGTAMDCSPPLLLLLLFSRSVVPDSLQPWTAAHRLPCPSLSPRVCSNSSPLNSWGHSTISSSVAPFTSCLQSFPASGAFQMSQLFPSGGQCIGISASTSVLPMYHISFGSHYCLEWVRTCSYNLPWIALDYGPSLCSTRMELNFILTLLSSAPSLSSTSIFSKVVCSSFACMTDWRHVLG